MIWRISNVFKKRYIKIRVRPIFYVNETTLEHVCNGIHGQWLTIYFLIIRRIPIY